MDAEKYNRSIPLQCPTCGSTEFKHSEESDVVKCASCNREITRDELIRENRENLQDHAVEFAIEAVLDLGQLLMRSLQDAFKGNKFIKLK